MKIVLFGANGQVGRETIAAAGDFPGFSLTPLMRADADLMVAGAAASAVARLKPDVVVNAAAWTAVDRAETEQTGAFRINADAAGEIAEACAKARARLIHLSTDYVFAGEGDAPLAEGAPTGPANVYGASKLKGEDLVRARHADHVVVRTSWVYSVYGVNFVRTMLRLAGTRAEISIVDDQRGGPTPAAAIARACLKIAARREGPAGTYHFQGAPETSWAGFAEAIFAAAKKPVRITRIRTVDYPTPAKRPLFTVLNCSKILRDYGLERPDWRADIVQTVDRLNKLGQSEI